MKYKIVAIIISRHFLSDTEADKFDVMVEKL